MDLRVKIREESEAAPTDLFDVPYGTELEDVISLIRRWGLSNDDGDLPSEGVYGQFRITGTEAFFEIIVPSL